MLIRAEYIKQSIETNLFFLRIMKEHLIFASAALTLKDAGLVPSLMDMKNKFEGLLIDTVLLANGTVDPKTINAGDIITPYTLNAETATQNYTGLPINTCITRMETSLINNSVPLIKPAMEESVNNLNQRIIVLLQEAIRTQKTLVASILSCKMFTNMYPTMLEHVTHEAEHYFEHLQTLQSHQSLTGGPKTTAEREIFWNHIMAEHARFIRGLLDPAEEDLIQKANGFSSEFDELAKAAKAAYEQIELVPKVTQESMTATKDISKFKEQATVGILECKIRSVILPLLSDHVLREANHYLKELREFKV